VKLSFADKNVLRVQLLFLAFILSGEVEAAKAAGPLRVHPTNPRYFTDGTNNPDGSVKAVYLTGSQTWGNLCDYRTNWPAFDFCFIEPPRRFALR